MSDHREHMKAFRSALGQFSNLAPRNMDTPEKVNATIDKAQAALEAIRPKVEVTAEPEAQLDLTTEDKPKRKRKAKAGQDRQHEGGMDRGEG